MAKSWYLIQQPRTLESWAKDQLGKWFSNEIEKLTAPIVKLAQRDLKQTGVLLTKQIEMIKKYLESNVPKILHDMFTAEAMKALKNLLDNELSNDLQSINRRAVFARMTAALFTKNLTSLTVDLNSRHAGMYTVICSNSAKLASLVKLDIGLISDYFYDDDDVIQLLKELKILKHLVLARSHITKNILKCIAENCKLIEELYIEQLSDHVEVVLLDEKIDSLSRLHHLRRIDLGNAIICKKGIASLLLSCKNIEEIITHYDETIPIAMNYIASLDGHSNKRFKLTLTKNGPDLQHHRLFLKLCPNIRKMVLTRFDYYDVATSENLNNLQELRELVFVGFESNEMLKILRMIGANLVDLSLQLVYELDTDALRCLGRACPNLESLVIQRSSFKPETDLLDDINIKTPSFRSLKVLKLEDLYQEVNRAQVYFLLSNSPMIEFIYMKAVSLDEETVSKVLEQNSMVYLKQLRLCFRNGHDEGTQTGLRSPMIDRMIRDCVNFPEVFIDLPAWVTDDQLKRLYESNFR